MDQMEDDIAAFIASQTMSSDAAEALRALIEKAFDMGWDDAKSLYQQSEERV